jgi:1,4-dihydroxy-2-naphthoyl-CoA hydrolase
MYIWKTPITLDNLQQRSKNTMVEYLDIEFIDVGDNYLKARMPVNQQTRQPLGIMHGGASCVLAETIGSSAANYCVDIAQYYCVGAHISTHHIKSVSTGFVFGTALPIHLGRSTQVWNIDIFDEQNNLISTTRLTMAVLAR